MHNYINYFTEIEDHFQKRRGALLLLSTLDWVLIETWREAGLPLEVVLRGVDAAFDKHDLRQGRAAARGKRLRPVNGLAWCAQAVIDAAEAAAHASADAQPNAPSPTPAETGFEPDRVAAFLRRNADTLDAATLPSVADTLAAEAAVRLRSLAASRDPASPSPPQPPHLPLEQTSLLTDPAHPTLTLEELDRTLSTLEDRLVAALLTATPETELSALRAEADRQLAPYRSRMGVVQLRQLQGQFVHKQLLQQHLLPRLSLFYMSVA